jgi:hypothetical protein
MAPTLAEMRDLNIEHDGEMEENHKQILEGMTRGDNGGQTGEVMQGSRILIEEIIEIGGSEMRAWTMIVGTEDEGEVDLGPLSLERIAAGDDNRKCTTSLWHYDTHAQQRLQSFIQLVHRIDSWNKPNISESCNVLFFFLDILRTIVRVC